MTKAKGIGILFILQKMGQCLFYILKSLLMSHPILLLIADHIFEKTVFTLTVFTPIIQKILAVMHIFSFTIMNYLKTFIGIKYLERKQCPAGYLL